MKQSTMQEGIDLAIGSVTLRRELKVVGIMKEWFCSRIQTHLPNVFSTF